MFENIKKITLVKNFMTKKLDVFVRNYLTFQLLLLKIEMLKFFIQMCKDFFVIKFLTSVIFLIF